MIIFGIIGLLLISYALWVKNEKYQNIVFIIGGACLLAYSIFIDDVIFIVLQVIFIASAFFEIIKKKKHGK